MSASVAGCASPSRVVADLAGARADVIAARTHIDLVVADHGLERTVDDALVRRPHPADRRIGNARVIGGIPEFDGSEQAIRARAPRHPT